MCFCYLRSENRDPQVCQRFKLTRFHLTQSMSSGGETSRWRTGKVAKRHVIVHTGVRSKIPRMIVSMLQVCQQRNGLHRIVCCRHIDFQQVVDGVRGRVQVGETDLIFVDPGVKINDASYQTKVHHVDEPKQLMLDVGVAWRTV